MPTYEHMTLARGFYWARWNENRRSTSRSKFTHDLPEPFIVWFDQHVGWLVPGQHGPMQSDEVEVIGPGPIEGPQ